MMIVGVLTLVATARDSVGEAGLVAATAGLGTAACGPGIGALADRLGQRRVLLAASALSVLASAALLFAVAAQVPLPVLFGIAIVLGGSTPQVAPFSRSRLVAFASVVRDADRRRRAVSYVMSYESIADEASFVLGPVLVGLLSALVNPAAPLVLSMLLTGTVVVAFALRADRRLPHAPAASAGKRTAARPLSLPAVLLAPGIPLLIAAMFLVGGVFGSTLTALTAFMRERGAVEQAGVVYGAMSIGAIAFALIVAVLPARFVLAARWPVFAVLGLAGCAALALGGDLVAVVPALALAGCGVGAVLVTLFSLGAAAAPHGRSTTVLTALQSTLVVGQAVVTALGGTLSERAGSGAGFAVAVGLAGGLAVLGLIALGRFRRRSRASTAQR
ncbi:MAG TPA: MFS transporter [Pseudolysinimonas sp.]|nr:MFS transporter [Pseudolysinimonas sp.]